MRVGVFLCVVAVCMLSGCRQQDPAFVQSHCPFISGSPIQPHLYRDVDGVRIFTCCLGCLDEVDQDPQEAIRRIHARGARPLSISEAEHRDETGALPYWAKKDGGVLWQKP